MTRVACGEGQVHSDLTLRSHDLWREIEQELGEREPLLVQNSLLLIADNDAAGHNAARFLDATLTAAERLGLPYEALSSADVRSRHPQFRIDDREKVYVDRVSGFARPEACSNAQLTLACRRGAQIRVGETVLSFSSTPDGVTVTTDKGVLEAGTLVLAAGPWMSQLLGADETTPFTSPARSFSGSAHHWLRISTRSGPIDFLFSSGCCRSPGPSSTVSRPLAGSRTG